MAAPSSLPGYAPIASLVRLHLRAKRHKSIEQLLMRGEMHLAVSRGEQERIGTNDFHPHGVAWGGLAARLDSDVPDRD
jgi:hypothetical protein